MTKTFSLTIKIMEMYPRIWKKSKIFIKNREKITKWVLSSAPVVKLLRNLF